AVPERYRVHLPALVELLDKAAATGEREPTTAAVAQQFRIRKRWAGPLLNAARARRAAPTP
ncbi:hypothetical protein, partial [Streptomyces lasiicapitis]